MGWQATGGGNHGVENKDMAMAVVSDGGSSNSSGA